MRIFGFVKKVFFIGLTILSGFTNTNSLSCISMKFQCCICAPDVVKDFLNVNGFNLMSGTDETRYI